MLQKLGGQYFGGCCGSKGVGIQGKGGGIAPPTFAAIEGKADLERAKPGGHAPEIENSQRSRQPEGRSRCPAGRTERSSEAEEKEVLEEPAPSQGQRPPSQRR